MERINGIFKKMALIYKLFALIALAVVGKIAYMQFIAPTDTTAVDIAYREETIEAIRGDIMARDGRPMATSVPYYQIRMDCVVPNEDTFKKYIDDLSVSLAEFFKNKSAKKYKEELVKARKDGKRYKALGNRLVDYTELAQIKKFPILKLGANRGGIIVEQKYRRNNPYGRLAYRTIGFINTEGVGVGIEGSCDYYLKGTPGKQTIQKMLGGEWRPVTGVEGVAPKDGYDILTTIDIEIQEAAEKALREQLAKGMGIEGGTAIVMEVATGAVRAIANMKKMGDSYDESYNYGIGDATEPGSVFKLMTLVSLLEDGYVTLEDPIDGGNGKWSYGGHTYSDTHAYGMMDVKTALAKSSNVAFAKLAVTYYEGKEQQYVDRLNSMKVGERFNLDIQGEGRASIYGPSDAMWSRSSLSSMAIGYATLLTPLHTLAFYNAIANDGKMMKPYFIENYQENGEIVKNFGPQVMSGSICSKETAREARRALRHVVEIGTGRFMNNSKFKIAGKTGTSRIAFGGKIGYEKNGFRRYQASFAGFYPADNPKYSAIVVLYSGETRGNFYGGSWAGPVFKQIADHIYSTSSNWEPVLDGNSKNVPAPEVAAGRLDAQSKVLAELGVEFTKVDINERNMSGWAKFSKDTSGNLAATNFSTDNDSLANVVNMGLKDAVYLLENSGYKVQFEGYGKVVAQEPAPGSKLPEGSTVILKLKENGDQ
ncbi:MAG: transpeptidase family protein [Bacteroidales bacterium]|nr:transpeptidase family protein [Bacteroidales bacterium]MBR4088965.1 transpeptidase family protein [Bacteroidales bacterium]